MGRAPALIGRLAARLLASVVLAPVVLAPVVLAAACGGSGSPADPDAGTPGMPDADLISFDFTGRYVDWDSTSAAPCPIAGAKWVARHDDTRTAVTDASGAFTIRLASYLGDLDVTPPAEASPCATPSSKYDLPVAAIVPPVVVHAGGRFVARAPTMARITTFYATFGATFDATRAHLLVHVDGPPRTVAITSPHAPVQAFDGTAWAAGALGADVFFPNIDLTASKLTTVSVGGGATGTGSVTLLAGKLTVMTVIPR